MMFRGAYTDEFYRALHDALHAEVDAWHPANNDDGNPTDQDYKFGGSSIEGKWAQLTQLEKICRNSDPTMLEGLPTQSLVQLQSAPDLARTCSSTHGSGSD